MIRSTKVYVECECPVRLCNMNSLIRITKHIGENRSYCPEIEEVVLKVERREFGFGGMNTQRLHAESKMA